MSVQKYERSEGFLANANLCSERSESQSHHRHQKRGILSDAPFLVPRLWRGWIRCAHTSLP